jgi:hypothetical protein
MEKLYRENCGNGNIGWRKRINPEIAGRVVSREGLKKIAGEEIVKPIKKIILEYLQSRDMNKLKELSPKGVFKKDITDILTEKKLVYPGGKVYIAGSRDFERSRRGDVIQISIKSPDCFNSSGAWFVWNMGERRGEKVDKGYVTFGKDSLFFKDDDVF